MSKFNAVQIAIFGFTGLWAIALYPTIIGPFMNPESYQKIQKETRKDIIQDEVQPGGMRTWSDPFQAQERQEPLFIQRAREEAARKAV